MWGFIQTAQQAVFDVVAPALGEGAEVEAAVASGDISRVARVCEENHLSVSQVRGGNGKNMLHVSCGRGNMEMTQYLLSSGCDIRGITNSKETCLHFAARSGNLEMVKMVVGHGISVCAKNSGGETAYDQARSYYDVRQYLLPLQLQQDTSAPMPFFATSSVEHARAQYSEVTQMGNERAGGENYREQTSSGYESYGSNSAGYGQQNGGASGGGYGEQNGGASGVGYGQHVGYGGQNGAPPNVYGVHNDGGSGNGHAPAPAPTLPAAAAPNPPTAAGGGNKQRKYGRNASGAKRGLSKYNDGFGSTVGNAALAAKYGNTTGQSVLGRARDNLPPPPTGDLGGGGPSSFASSGTTPIASRRYVGVGATGYETQYDGAGQGSNQHNAYSYSHPPQQQQPGFYQQPGMFPNLAARGQPSGYQTPGNVSQQQSYGQNNNGEAQGRPGTGYNGQVQSFQQPGTFPNRVHQGQHGGYQQSQSAPQQQQYAVQANNQSARYGAGRTQELQQAPEFAPREQQYGSQNNGEYPGTPAQHGASGTQQLVQQFRQAPQQEAAAHIAQQRGPEPQHGQQAAHLFQPSQQQVQRNPQVLQTEAATELFQPPQESQPAQAATPLFQETQHGQLPQQTTQMFQQAQHVQPAQQTAQLFQQPQQGHFYDCLP